MKKSDVPHEPHYVIMKVEQVSVHHAADQRSKECPGHGYPAYTSEHEAVEYKTFPDTAEGRQQWEEELRAELFAHKMSHNRDGLYIFGFHVNLVARAQLDVELDIRGETS